MYIPGVRNLAAQMEFYLPHSPQKSRKKKKKKTEETGKGKKEGRRGNTLLI